MEEKHAREFYLTYFLLITGFSFLLFTLMLNIVDGVYIKLFFWIGLIALALGLLTGANILVNRANRRNKNNLIS
jgi:hypothetical protein